MPKSLGLIWLSQATFDLMIEEADAHFPFETGGSLLGYWVTPGKEVVVTEATGPGPEAQHFLRSFVPDDTYQEQVIAEHYQASGRLHVYLGDWHTHPGQANIALSRIDRLTLRKIAKSASARMPTPIMIVLGGEPWSLQTWQYEKSFLSALRFGIRTLPMELRIYSHNIFPHNQRSSLI